MSNSSDPSSNKISLGDNISADNNKTTKLIQEEEEQVSGDEDKEEANDDKKVQQQGRESSNTIRESLVAVAYCQEEHNRPRHEKPHYAPPADEQARPCSPAPAGESAVSSSKQQESVHDESSEKNLVSRASGDIITNSNVIGQEDDTSRTTTRPALLVGKKPTALISSLETTAPSTGGAELNSSTSENYTNRTILRLVSKPIDDTPAPPTHEGTDDDPTKSSVKHQSSNYYLVSLPSSRPPSRSIGSAEDLATTDLSTNDPHDAYLARQEKNVVDKKVAVVQEQSHQVDEINRSTHSYSWNTILGRRSQVSTGTHDLAKDKDRQRRTTSTATHTEMFLEQQRRVEEAKAPAEDEASTNAIIFNPDEQMLDSSSLPDSVAEKEECHTHESDKTNSRERRLAMNRATAKIRRDRKLQYLSDLEEQVQNMIESNNMFIAQNNELREQIVKIKNEITLLQQVGSSTSSMVPPSLISSRDILGGTSSSLPTSQYIDRQRAAFLGSQSVDFLQPQRQQGNNFLSITPRALLNSIAGGESNASLTEVTSAAQQQPYLQQLVTTNFNRNSDNLTSMPHSSQNISTTSLPSLVPNRAGINQTSMSNAMAKGTRDEISQRAHTSAPSTRSHQLPVSSRIATTSNRNLASHSFGIDDMKQNLQQQDDDDDPSISE
jgi:bZIP transcription factor.